MGKNTYKKQALTTLAVCAMLYMFFVQSRIVMRPTGLDLAPMEVAYGYSNVTFGGTVYWDEGTTPVGSGTGVAIYINGSAASTTTTGANGTYSFTGLTIDPDDVVSVFVDGENEDGMLVAKFNEAELSDTSVTGMDIYEDRLLLRTSTTDLGITTTDLNTADGNASDADITAVYTIANSDVHLGNNKELLIYDSTTHVASGDIFTHDLDVRGTLTMGSGDITASGSFVVGSAGTITISGDTILTSIASNETFKTRTSSLGNVYIDNGLYAYFRFDEGSGLNASGATLNTSTGGSLMNGASWITTHSGTTLFYNPHSIDLDGTDDYISYGDAFDMTTSVNRTYATWVKRNSSTTDDVIFSKKSTVGSGNIGYELYIDDSSDQLIFEVADGSNTYSITSDSTITDTSWHHIGVTWNPVNTDDSNIFIDGSIDVSAKTGSLNPASANYTNALSFIIGSDANETDPFHGSIDDFRIYSRTMTGAEMSVLSAGNASTGLGKYTLTSDLDVNGDLGIYGGTLDVGSDYSITVSGDLSIYGTLSTNSGTVTLDGTSSQNLRGSTAFNALAATSTVTKTLTFESNTQQTVSGALTLNGAVNNHLSLRASYTGNSAMLIVEDSGATLLKHLNVKDNNASSGATLVCTEGCVDSLNNTNWVFDGDCQDGVVNTGEQCDDGNSDNTDSCPNDCQYAVCGDNVIEGGEQCEPPDSGQCLSNCLLRSAGGGGGKTFSAASSTSVKFSTKAPPEGCGNSIIQTDLEEECDDGLRNNGNGTCSYDCKILFCGDGKISSHIGEGCEPTVLSTENGVTEYEVVTCGETCSLPVISAQNTIIGGCQRQILPACIASSESSIAPEVENASCGNGVVEGGEECDEGGVCEGGTFTGSIWTNSASAETCRSGGGTPKPRSGDGCSDTCHTEFCGDGMIQVAGQDQKDGTADDEQCDNGSVCSNDAEKVCRTDSECGTGNTCEYDSIKNTGCSDSCKNVQGNPFTPVSTSSEAPEICGNGLVESLEQCDDGNTNNNDSCSNICTKNITEQAASTKAECGNAIVDFDEQCDNGDKNSDVIPDACRTNCTIAQCSDHVVDSHEQCDNGEGNSDYTSDTCRTNCRLPRCGDGVVDSGEQCDGSLHCTTQCTKIEQAEVCGNGVKEKSEQCDDGNILNGDGCNFICSIEDNKKTSAQSLVLDGDVVVVNPTEYANVLKFTGNNPCSILTIKGKNIKASLIREAAVRQRIPVVKNIDLAHAIYDNVDMGQQIAGDLCVTINTIKKNMKQVYQEPTQPSAPQQNNIPVVIQQPLPTIPTTQNYGFYNMAPIAQVIQGTAPAGDTGPATATLLISGIAGGVGWVRRRKRR